MVNPSFAGRQAAGGSGDFSRLSSRRIKDTRKNRRCHRVRAQAQRTANKEIELERLQLALRDNILTPGGQAQRVRRRRPARLDKAIDQIALNLYLQGAMPKAGDVFDASFPAAGSRAQGD